MKVNRKNAIAACVMYVGLVGFAHLCDAQYIENVNLTNGTPSGWTSTIRNNGSISGGRMTVAPTDGSVTLSKTLNFSNTIQSVQISCRCWMAPTTWGDDAWLTIQTSNNGSAALLMATDQTLYPGDYDVRLYGTSNTLFNLFPPKDTEAFRCTLLTQPGQVSFQILRDSDSSVYAAGQTNSSSFRPDLTTNISFEISSSTDSGTWMDNLVVQIQFQQPSMLLKKAVKPSFSNLQLGTNYQLQVSSDMKTWTNQGSPFAPTNTVMDYPQYWDVANWGGLYFRLQVSP